jgi:hypothetical protein
LAEAVDLPDAEQMARLIESPISPFRDEAFVYEGDRRWVGPSDIENGDPEYFDTNFQGSFAYRSDGAFFQDVLSRKISPSAGLLVRETGAILNGKTDTLLFVPDRNAGNPTSANVARPYVLAAVVGSPLRINFISTFLNPKGLVFTNYKCHGYEHINSHRCLHIEFNTVPNAVGDTAPRTHYWIDLERGAHPLRVEYRRQGRLVSRANIELQEIETAEDKSLWFPIDGTVEKFALNGQWFDNPILRDRIHVVATSLRINSGLKDSVFSIGSSGGVADTSSLRRLREEFFRQPPPPKFRTDVKGVQERLERDLAKANAQAKMLDASRPEGPDWLMISQLGLGIAALSILITALYLKWKLR